MSANSYKYLFGENALSLLYESVKEALLFVLNIYSTYRVSKLKLLPICWFFFYSGNILFVTTFINIRMINWIKNCL